MGSRTIRFRVTFTATVVVTIVLLIASAVLVTVQRRSLTASIDQTLAQRAEDIVALLAEGAAPREFAPSASEGFAQLVAADQTVIAATPNLAGEPALEIAYQSSGDTIASLSGLPADDDVFRVLSRPMGDGVLHVGSTYDVVTETSVALLGALAFIIPALTGILALMTWWLVGRTLRPVEAIRSEVAMIEAPDLHRRVPEPGTRDEIDRLASTMNEMLARLQASVDAQRRFVADASHELRSPLTRLRAELELALKGGEDRMTRLFLEETVRLQDIVDDLLFLARSDSGSSRHAVARVDLDDLVLEEAKKLEGRVELDLGGLSGAQVVGDAGQLRRAVRNLLDNSCRYARSKVSIELTETPETVILVVSDDGPGVPPALALRIFDRFGRIDESRSGHTGGTGLGLSIAREIAESHGGTLTLDNPGERGARFIMRLPVAD